MTIRAGNLGNCKKRRTVGERPLNALKTREKIGIRNWEYVRFVDVDMVLCSRESARKRTLRGGDKKKIKDICLKKKI